MSRSAPVTFTRKPANIDEALVEIDMTVGIFPTVTVCVFVSFKPSLSVTVSESWKLPAAA